jgi:hypothetical protein
MLRPAGGDAATQPRRRLQRNRPNRRSVEVRPHFGNDGDAGVRSDQHGFVDRRQRRDTVKGDVAVNLTSLSYDTSYCAKRRFGL